MCNFRTNRFSDSLVVTKMPTKPNSYNPFALTSPSNERTLTGFRSWLACLETVTKHRNSLPMNRFTGHWGKYCSGSAYNLTTGNRCLYSRPSIKLMHIQRYYRIKVRDTETNWLQQQTTVKEIKKKRYPSWQYCHFSRDVLKKEFKRVYGTVFSEMRLHESFIID